MPGKTLNVALIGAGFMGKAHSNAYRQVGRFFDLPVDVVMHTLVSRRPDHARAMARRWGWANWSDDAAAVIADPAIDLVDLCTPNRVHVDHAVLAARAGKAVASEKPIAQTLSGARRMADAARRAHVPSFAWFNYRFAPAVALARQLIEEGRLGRIYHFRAAYLQDWSMDPSMPLLWRFQRPIAGAGTLGDIGAHLIDLARFLVGELREVAGRTHTFIKRRSLKDNPRRTGPVTVPDAAAFMARFDNGALGVFEATRFARGRKNCNSFEVNGERGSIAFCFERMNELEYFDATSPRHVQGFTRLVANDPVCHPFAGQYWPVGHGLGYEHCHLSELACIVQSLAGAKRAGKCRVPDFADGLACQAVVEAVERSHRLRRWVKVK